MKAPALLFTHRQIPVFVQSYTEQEKNIFQVFYAFQNQVYGQELEGPELPPGVINLMKVGLDAQFDAANHFVLSEESAKPSVRDPDRNNKTQTND